VLYFDSLPTEYGNPWVSVDHIPRTIAAHTTGILRYRIACLSAALTDTEASSEAR
jgi:hypothetical protein